MSLPHLHHGKRLQERKIYSLLPLFNITLALCILFAYAVHITHNIRILRNSLDTSLRTTFHIPVPNAQAEDDSIPLLFIFRRSKKTGSTTILDALQRVLLPHGYVPIYDGPEEAGVIARSENLRSHPRRLLIANHGQVTKGFARNRRAVIADSFRDGYQQMTSFCRFFGRVKECDERLIECLKSEHVVHENYYRWAYQKDENADNYVDLPLSPAHPALSSTVLRSVFPNATIEIDNYNIANSTCPEIPVLREVYNKYYQTLERQIQSLRKRMLIITGYPTEADPNLQSKISLEEMLDAAEAMETLKYNISERAAPTTNRPRSVKVLLEAFYFWTKDDNNSVALRPRFRDSRKRRGT